MLTREAIESNLEPLGLTLPRSHPVPRGLYSAVRVDSGVAWTSALGPLAIDGSGTFAFRGEIGSDLTEQAGREAAALTALHLIASLDQKPGLNRVVRLLDLVAYVRANDEFERHPYVADGASEVLLAAFGDEVGSHARTVVGVLSLPFAVPFVAALRASLNEVMP